MNHHWITTRQSNRPLCGTSHVVVNYSLVGTETRFALRGQSSILNYIGNNRNRPVSTCSRSISNRTVPAPIATIYGSDAPQSNNQGLPEIPSAQQRPKPIAKLTKMQGCFPAPPAQSNDCVQDNQARHTSLPKLKDSNKSSPPNENGKIQCNVVNLRLSFPPIQRTNSVQQTEYKKKSSGVKKFPENQQQSKKRMSVVDFSSAVTSLAKNTHNTNTSQQRLCDLPKSRFHLPPLVKTSGRQTTIEMARSVSKPEIKKEKTSRYLVGHGRMKVIGRQVQ